MVSEVFFNANAANGLMTRIIFKKHSRNSPIRAIRVENHPAQGFSGKIKAL